MEQQKIDRINELSRLSRQRTLTEEEKKEQQQLRSEYIANWRKGARQTLDNTYVIGPDGIKRKLGKKKSQS
jgi:uncharacterized protein YnzC (UPF0291/DUF896 family)